jgi:hypothetical protein
VLDVDDFLDTLRRVAANGRDSREEHHDQLGLPERFRRSPSGAGDAGGAGLSASRLTARRVWTRCLLLAAVAVCKSREGAGVAVGGAEVLLSPLPPARVAGVADDLLYGSVNIDLGVA